MKKECSYTSVRPDYLTHKSKEREAFSSTLGRRGQPGPCEAVLHASKSSHEEQTMPHEFREATKEARDDGEREHSGEGHSKVSSSNLIFSVAVCVQGSRVNLRTN